MGKSLDRGGRRQRSLADFIGRGRCGEKRNDHGFKAIDGVYQWRGVTAALKFLYVGEERTRSRGLRTVLGWARGRDAWALAGLGAVG
jgi:hypothetical protein